MPEEWRPVPGHEAGYEVSSSGKFRRVAAGKGAVAGRPLSTQRRSAKGYVVVELSWNDVKRRVFAHRLVAAAFHGPPLPGQVVNHKDGIKTNNAASNLEWVTAAENARHAAEHGLLRPCRGEMNGRAKLTAADASAIRSLEGEVSQREIARRFGVARSLVQRIQQGKLWAR